MAKHEDLTGFQYENIRVVSYEGTNKRRQALWACLCHCGSGFTAAATKLKSGRVKSCGCGAANKSPPMIGKRFGKLVVVAEQGVNGSRAKTWKCHCDCGKTAAVAGSKLRAGHTKSCGCLVIEKVSKLNFTHGLSSAPEYEVWQGMWARTSNPNHASYANYGGRGIKVCERWGSFENFLADMGTRPEAVHGRYSIERVNNDGNYEPSNCKWADSLEQARNKRKRKDRP